MAMEMEPDERVPAGSSRRRGGVMIGPSADPVPTKSQTSGFGRLKGIWVKMAQASTVNKLVEELGEDLDFQLVSEKPDSLDSLLERSLFTKEEIRMVYRRFKQECPNGILTEEIFRTVFQQFFPIGDTSQYAHFVFNTFKRNSSGNVTFASFIETMSVMTKGTTEQKLEWIFNLYDVDRDGCLSQHDVRLILESMYFMVGKDIETEERSLKRHVKYIFKKYGGDGGPCDEITKDSFINTCIQNREICSSVAGYTSGLL